METAEEGRLKTEMNVRRHLDRGKVSIGNPAIDAKKVEGPQVSNQVFNLGPNVICDFARIATDLPGLLGRNLGLVRKETVAERAFAGFAPVGRDAAQIDASPRFDNAKRYLIARDKRFANDGPQSLFDELTHACDHSPDVSTEGNVVNTY